MRPELPYLGAGAVAIIGGTIREGKFPSDGVKALLGTLILVTAASTTAGSKIAPLVRAIGFLLLLASIMATVNAVNAAKKGKK